MVLVWTVEAKLEWCGEMLEVCSVPLCCLNFTCGLSALYLLQILNRDGVLMLSVMGQRWLGVGEISVTPDQTNVNKFM